ncbi:MAG: FecR domain-containing protein [Deltaproteobacteria bacterium]|nr:FecR domain-containing protein [Deltaproteobacteria bacterium]
MRISKGKLHYLFCALAILLLAGISFAATLPEGVVVEETFKPGIGSPIGRVSLVQGTAVIIHMDSKTGYRAKKDIPLFKNDSIITLEGGRIRFELSDESIMTLASNTRVILNKSVFQKEKGYRVSFLSMTLGKARFYVQKFLELKNSDFRVKTPTAVIGARGSDFIIVASVSLTEVTALEDTELEVVSLALPEVAPTVLVDFERTFVEEGVPPTEPEEISIEDVEEMKKDFVVIPEEVGPEADIGVEDKKTEDSDTGTLVSEEEVVNPENIIAFEDINEFEIAIEEITEGAIEQSIVESIEEEILESAEGIYEIISEVDYLPPTSTDEGNVTLSW